MRTEVDPCGDEADFKVRVSTLWLQFLGGDVEGTVYGEYGWYSEELFQAGVAVEVEALEVRKVIRAGLNEELIQAVYEGTVVAYAQVRTEGGTNEFSFTAGNAEATGSTFGRCGLSYFIRHATEEIFTISAVADDVVKSAGEFVNADLKGHGK